MFKDSSNSASHKALRNTKAIESSKQPFFGKSKIMLTDLCPEEKAKIGELVRTLEARKKEAENLKGIIAELEYRQ